MCRYSGIAVIILLGLLRETQSLEIPLHPGEVQIAEMIVAVEGHSVEVAEVPGWAMKGRLRTLDLSMTLANVGDLVRLRADHPDAKITTIPPAEIVKRHSFVAGRIARIATGEAAEQLNQVLAEHKADRKSSKQRTAASTTNAGMRDLWFVLPPQFSSLRSSGL